MRLISIPTPVYVSSSRRSRSCWKVGIPRCLRDFQARWESRFLDFSTERLFNSLLCRPLRNRLTLTGISPQASWSVGDAEGAVQMLVNDDIASSQSAAPAYFVDLERSEERRVGKECRSRRS